MHSTCGSIHSVKKSWKIYMIMEISWNVSAGVPSCSFAFFELKKYPSLKLGAFFILSYITIIFYSFLLVWITLLSWHIVMQVFEVFFPLVVTIFTKLVLWSSKFDVISSQTKGTYWMPQTFWKLYILLHLKTDSIILL